MIFFYGTTEERWKTIQEEDVLLGYQIHKKKNERTYKTLRYRYTYLTPLKNIAEQYGSVLLGVNYEPVGIIDGKIIDNYDFDPPSGQICLQFSVFVPTPLSNVRRIK